MEAIDCNWMESTTDSYCYRLTSIKLDLEIMHECCRKLADPINNVINLDILRRDFLQLYVHECKYEIDP